MENLPLRLQVELNGIDPSPELGSVAQSYAKSLCTDLSLPFSPSVTVAVIPPGRPSVPSPFQITLNGRPLRNRFWPAPQLLEKPTPSDVAVLVALAVYERRELFVTPELAVQLRNEWEASNWPSDTFFRFLSYFPRYNFSLERARSFIKSQQKKLKESEINARDPFLFHPEICFEKAIELSLLEDREQTSGFGVAANIKFTDDPLNAYGNELGIFVPKLKSLDSPEEDQVLFRINDVTLPAIEALPSNRVLLWNNSLSLAFEGRLEPLSGYRYIDADKSEAEAKKASIWLDTNGYATHALRSVVFGNAGSLLASPVVHLMVEQTWLRTSKYLVAAAEQKFAHLRPTHYWLTAILRRMLDESVPVRDLPRILENLLFLRDVTADSKSEVHYFSERADCPLRIYKGTLGSLTSLDPLLVAARLGVHPVSENLAGQQAVPVLRLPPQLERSLAALSGEPIDLALASQLAEYLSQQQRDQVSIVVSQRNRAAIQQSLRFEFPTLFALGSAEVPAVRYAAATAEASRSSMAAQTGTAVGLAIEASREQPLDPVLRENLGRIHSHAGDYEKAGEQYQLALALASNPQQLLSVADADFQIKDYEDALRLYRGVAQKFNRPELYALLGARLSRLGAWVRSGEAYETALRLDPRNASYCADLAAARAEQADSLTLEERRRQLYGQAIAWLNAAIQMEAGVASFYHFRSALFAKLVNLESSREARDGLQQRAKSDLREAIRLDTSSQLKWSIELAQLLARHGEFNEAESVLNTLPMDHSSEPSIRMELAKIFSEADDFEKACQQAEAAGKLAQQPAPEIQEFLKLSNEGLDAARKAKAEPENPALEIVLGSVQSRLGHLNAALRHYQRAAELDSSSFEAHKQLGTVYYKQNRTREAINEWLKAGEDFLTLNNLGTAYDALNDYEHAEAYYRRGHEMAPKNFVPLYNLGSLHYRLGNWVQSRDFYTEASELNPQFAAAHLNRGNANFRLERFNDAESDWRTAIQRDDRLADAFYNLGVSLWSRHANLDEAVRCWKQAWLLDFNFTLAEDNMLAAKEGEKPNLEIVDLKNLR